MIGTRHLVKGEDSLDLPLFHPQKGRGHFRIANLPAPFHLVSGMMRFPYLSPRERWDLLNVGTELRRRNSEDLAGESDISVEEWLARLGQSEEARRCLWYPIAISVMNESPSRASAALFARVLRAAFLGSRSDSAMLIPSVGQTELYVTAAEALLRKRGAVVRVSNEVASILISEGAAQGVRLADGSEIGTRYLLCTVPPFVLSRILPPAIRELPPFTRLDELGVSPIVSVHLWFAQDFMPDRFIGLIGGTLQWIFNRRRIIPAAAGGPAGYISGVISGAHATVDLPKERIVEMALRDLASIYPEARDATFLRSVVLKEKRATFSPGAAQEHLRPDAATPVRNFYLAGDWTNTGYPATIEGAVMSGFRAADLIIKAEHVGMEG